MTTDFSEVSAFSEIREALGRLCYIAGDSDLPPAQKNKNTNAKVVYLGVVYSNFI